MLEYNEVTLRKYVLFEGEPFEVMDSHVFRKQQRKPVNATKLKSLLTGRIVEHSFHVSDKVEEAEIGTREVKYLYTTKGELWFCDPKNPSDRFNITAEMIGPQSRFLKPNMLIDANTFEEKIIGVRMPVKVELAVKEAAAAVKGNTVSGGSKTVILENGTEINVPLFIEQGDILRINTETGDYVERANK